MDIFLLFGLISDISVTETKFIQVCSKIKILYIPEIKFKLRLSKLSINLMIIGKIFDHLIINGRTEPAAASCSTCYRRGLFLLTSILSLVFVRDYVHQMYLIGVHVLCLKILISTDNLFRAVCPSSIQWLLID